MPGSRRPIRSAPRARARVPATLLALPVLAAVAAAVALLATCPAPAWGQSADTLQFHARAALTDTLLDRLTGVWQGSPAGEPGTVDRLIGQWKYEHTLVQLQSRTTAGARKDFETVGFVRREGDGRYRMSCADASGAVLCLEGRQEGLALVLNASSPEGQVRLRYDLSRKGRLILTREEAQPAGEFRKVSQLEYVRGRLKGR
jgi:hypothetical protein